VLTWSLRRFHAAQERAEEGFEAALCELRGTGKRGHWIWYVFPQLAGLGGSSMAREYAIQGRDEALGYLHDPVLRSRLLEATRAVKDRLGEGWPLERVMGSHIDCVKLVSSLTLFEWAARTVAEGDGETQGTADVQPQGEGNSDAHSEARSRQAAKDGEECETLAALAAEVLAMASQQGFAPCEFTLRVVGK